jgi:hypothetical protein
MVQSLAMVAAGREEVTFASVALTELSGALSKA